MPLFLDVHHLPGATKEDLAKAHVADLEAQEQHGVTYHRYWFNHECGKAFCLVDAPNAEAANAVHLEAHGLVADKIIPVDPEVADGFLGGVHVNGAGAATLFATDGDYDTGNRCIVFTDIVGSTEMGNRLGDAKTVQLIAKHDSLVARNVAEHGGRVIKYLGDGIMASFVSPVQAVQCCCEIQKAVAELHREDEEDHFELRIGAATGEPIERGDDLFGSTVNLAARLCKEARPGTILVTDEIAGLCRDAGLDFADTQQVELRGFDGQVPTREVVITC